MKKGKFDTKMLLVIFTLAWPTMLEQLMQTAVQYIDTAMVGALGTQATASVGATTTVNWLINGTVSSLGVGFLAYISRAKGAGETEKAHRAAAQAVTVTMIAGIIFTLVPVLLSGRVPVWMQVEPSIRDVASRYFLILYLPMLFRTASIIFGTILRAVGDTKTPMRVGIMMNLINVVLNFLMIYSPRDAVIFSKTVHIFGFGWGVVGAAAASAVSYAVGGIVMTARLWRHEAVSPSGMRFAPDMEILRPCFKVALPNTLQRFATSLGYVAFASMINALGDVSTAAHTVANTVESLFYIPGYGMQAAAATLSGNAFGARDGKRLKSLGRTIIPLEICLMVFSGGMLFLFAPALVGLFSKDSEVIALGTTVLRMVAVSEPFYGVPIVVEGMMQGVGKTVAPFVYNVLGMWCVRIVGTFICTWVLSYGLVSAWACMIGHNLLLFVLFTVHYLSGRALPRIGE